MPENICSGKHGRTVNSPRFAIPFVGDLHLL